MGSLVENSFQQPCRYTLSSNVVVHIKFQFQAVVSDLQQNKRQGGRGGDEDASVRCVPVIGQPDEKRSRS